MALVPISNLTRPGVLCCAPRVTTCRTKVGLCRPINAYFVLALACEGFASVPGMETDNTAAKRDADGPPSTPPDVKKAAPTGVEERGPGCVGGVQGHL